MIDYKKMKGLAVWILLSQYEISLTWAMSILRMVLFEPEGGLEAIVRSVNSKGSYLAEPEERRT